jgi:L-2-hydroxyglutarate oxidase LhgO
MLAFHAPLERGRITDDGIELEVGGAEKTALSARTVINSAGLHAPALARRLHGLNPDLVPVPYFCKGNYFTLSGARPFRHLIYPVPEQAGVGVHVTIDLAGQVRFGPDVEWLGAMDYDVDPARAAVIYDAVRKSYPGLKDGAIVPGYAGIRPKISPTGTQAADFVVQGPAAHGVPGLVNLFAIESPGLTACLALAEEVEVALEHGVSRAA